MNSFFLKLTSVVFYLPCPDLCKDKCLNTTHTLPYLTVKSHWLFSSWCCVFLFFFQIFPFRIDMKCKGRVKGWVHPALRCALRFPLGTAWHKLVHHGGTGLHIRDKYSPFSKQLQIAIHLSCFPTEWRYCRETVRSQLKLVIEHIWRGMLGPGSTNCLHLCSAGDQKGPWAHGQAGHWMESIS